MKKYFKLLLMPLAIIGIVGLSSCKKYLNKSPLADIDAVEAFKNFQNFQGFTEELYGCIPVLTAIGSHNNWNFGEDEMWEPTENRLLAYNIDNGSYWEWNSAIFGSWFKNGGSPSSQGNGDKGNLWGLAWYGIRKANIGIANLDLLVEATDEEKKLIEGQLYFFRGWFHFMLMQYWGGLPYVDMVIPSDQTPTIPRLNYQATADKATADFQKAADLLPLDWDDTEVGKRIAGSENNRYRANKIMAMAFMGKNLLLAGSPLMNRESTGSSSYNVEYCKKAADVFGAVLKLIEETGKYSLANFADYPQLFFTRNQNGAIPGTIRKGDLKVRESIFMENLAGAAGRFRWNQINDYRPPTINSSGIKVYPTANYVHLYGMANGLPIVDPEKADPESGYDPEYPWRNRDPRFYHDIVIDGEKMVNDPARVGNDLERQYASLFTGGKYRTLNPNKAVWTGYMLSKFFPRMLNDWDGNIDNNAVVLSLLRLPDVYLMYAEAASEGYNSPTAKVAGYSKSAVDAVNFVRSRPGLGVGEVAAKFLVSQEAFRNEYRRERAVELAFEGHRFVDLRRWLLLTQRPYTYKKGIEFDRATPNAEVYANPREARVRNFRETVLFERQFSDRHYWFPFILKEVNMYPEFPQNPGW
jgi:hypothetical protein